jgi:hypothetical protein
MTIEEALALLADTPRRIATLTDGLTPAQLRTAPDHDEWSANDVLAHLRSCADVWGGYIARILAEDGPAIRAVSPRSWIRRTGYPAVEFQPSLRAFTAQRAELLAVLNPLPAEGWSRAATVNRAGKTLEETVLDSAERLARHERVHTEQVARIVEALHGARPAPARSAR